MSIAVIVVNYGTADLAVAAVESVLSRDHGGRAVEVHLVDNASPGDDAQRLTETHVARGWGARVTLWPEGHNHGFGGGNNVVLTALAARETPPDFVFLLNPDAQLDTEALADLAAALEAAPRAAAAGASIRDPRTGPATAAFRFPTLAGEVLRTIDFGPLDRIFGHLRTSLSPDHPGGQVDWVSGAAVMFRFSALQKVGFFDPGFFLYYEEVELMHRLGKAGWEVLYVPAAHVMHEEGASTGGGGRRRERPAYLYESWRHYFALTRGRGRTLLAALLMIPAAGLNVLQRRLRGKTPTIPSRFLRDHWRFVIRPLAGGRS